MRMFRVALVSALACNCVAAAFAGEEPPASAALVNRVFDADSASGIDFIKQLKGEEALTQTPVMLVSNYEDAQQLAIEVGAVPGFGKAALGTPPMIAQVRKLLGE